MQSKSYSSLLFPSWSYVLDQHLRMPSFVLRSRPHLEAWSKAIQINISPKGLKDLSLVKLS